MKPVELKPSVNAQKEITDTNSGTIVRQSPCTYQQAVEKVMSLADFERAKHSPSHSAYHLERISLLLDALGNPQLTVPTIHVAGSKGKGSTAAMLTSILTAAGYKVGLYTSPHLHSFVERIRVGLLPVTKRRFASIIEAIWPLVEKVNDTGPYGPITTFECLTAMAFKYFAQIKADFQIIEVGLGGRLDATNVVKPEICAIAPISLDHIETLGHTIPEIANEKAGIIKKNVPVVISLQSDGAMSVLEQVACKQRAPVHRVDKQVSWRHIAGNLEGQSISVTGRNDTYDTFLPLLGNHQIENAATAIRVAELLANTGVKIAKHHVEQGLRNVKWPARLEVICSSSPQIVVDGAHNDQSVRNLIESIKSCFKFQRIILVFGVLNGHSIDNMMSELTSLGPLVIAVQSRHPRAMQSEAVIEAASNKGLIILGQFDSVRYGLRKALTLAGPKDLILGTGSLSVAAEIIEEVNALPPELYDKKNELHNQYESTYHEIKL